MLEISRDLIFELLKSAAVYYRAKGCYIAVIVFARQKDCTDYIDSVAFRLRFDMPKPIMISAPGGLYGTVVAAADMPEVPTSLPCSGHVSGFHASEMRVGRAAELALSLESKIAELAFAYFKPESRPTFMTATRSIDEQLGEMIRKMPRAIGDSRLVCAVEGKRIFWYVLKKFDTGDVIVGTGTEPELALDAALKELDR